MPVEWWIRRRASRDEPVVREFVVDSGEGYDYELTMQKNKYFEDLWLGEIHVSPAMDIYGRETQPRKRLVALRFETMDEGKEYLERRANEFKASSLKKIWTMNGKDAETT
jgi:hypothetical protein